jgi:putative ABC transport system substrate-binding protein
MKKAAAASFLVAVILCTVAAVSAAQQTTKFEFVINLKAAKQIGLTLSPEFLSRANQVIR